MLFYSQQFIVFFLAVFGIYWAMPWQRARVYFLLLVSFLFYCSWNEWLATLIVVSSTLDFWIARRIDSSRRARERKILLGLSIGMNLAVLCYFKYANFFLRSLEDGLRTAGLSYSFPILSVILPVGISFYTFEAISYTVDVFRRRIKAECDLGHFMLFILFFPHLIAGPVVRARDFLPQTHRPKRWDWARMNLGVQYFLLGLFKKWAIADRMACFVDPVFANPSEYPIHTLWIAVFAYALQIYGDFSGYTDMAIGTAHLLGYKLAVNFNMPYLARNIAEFWHRWHISLSTWLRDYLFIPLGGSRGSCWWVYRNLLITMTLGGLWHGASWNFIIWGVVHGLLLIMHRIFRELVETRPALDRALHSWVGSACCMGITFIAICFTWVLFRASSLEQAGLIFRNLFVPSGGNMPAPVHPSGLLYTYLVVLGACAIARQKTLRRVGHHLPAPVIGLGYALLLTFTVLLVPANGKAFIYFQF